MSDKSSDWSSIQNEFKKFMEQSKENFSHKKLNNFVRSHKLNEPSKEKKMSKCTISKEIEFDAGHRVSTHGSKCRNPHGHRYKIRVTCRGSIIDDPSRPDHGMLVDFGNLKNIMNEKIHDVLDHSFVVWTEDKIMKVSLEAGDSSWLVVEFPYIPTAENIARWSWEQLVDAVREEFGGDLELEEVAVWETPTSVAYYQGAPEEKTYYYWKSAF